MSMTTAISAEGLTRRYGVHTAVDNVNLQVEQGEIFGFLGPNGAGKTTTIMMLLGILPPTSGSVQVLGHEMGEGALELKTRVGVVSEHQSLYGEMTAEQYMGFFADMYAVPDTARRIGELLGALDLAARRHSRVKEFSRGMQQKLALARALLHSPDLLIMDEPASGLDPYGISQVRELIYAQKRAGKTVFLSSHILSEIEQTADRVAIIALGAVVAQGTVAEVRGKLAPDERYTLEYQGNEQAIRQALADVAIVREVQSRGGKLLLHVTAAGGQDARADISRAVAAAGGVVLSVNRLEISLEEAFLTATEGKVKRTAVRG